MAEIKFTSVMPKNKLRYSQATGRYNEILTDFAAGAINHLKTYPPFIPWSSPPPTSGPRMGGRRTGTLGKNWSSSFEHTAKGAGTVGALIKTVKLENNTPYASFVQGKRQTAVMKRRGWSKVDGPEVAAELSKAIRKNSKM